MTDSQLQGNGFPTVENAQAAAAEELLMKCQP